MRANWDDRGVSGYGEGAEGVASFERVMLAAMQAKMQLRMRLYAMACLLLLVCAVLIVFAPQGRETAVIIVSLALLLVAGGCAGIATFKLKAPGVDFEAAAPAERNEGDAVPGGSTGASHPEEAV